MQFGQYMSLGWGVIAYKQMFAMGRGSKSRVYVLARITLFPQNIALVVVKLSSHIDKLFTY